MVSCKCVAAERGSVRQRSLMYWESFSPKMPSVTASFASLSISWLHSGSAGALMPAPLTTIKPPLSHAAEIFVSIAEFPGKLASSERSVLLKSMFPCYTCEANRA